MKHYGCSYWRTPTSHNSKAHFPLPPPLIITAQMECPLFSIPQYREWSPPPKNPREHSLTPERHTTPKCAPPLRHPTPQHDATPTRKWLEKNSMTFKDISVIVEDDGDLGSPLTSLSDEDNELESEEDGKVNSTKIPKPLGEAGHPQSGGYNLQEKLGWNNKTYESVIVSMSKVYMKDSDWKLQALVHKMAKAKLKSQRVSVDRIWRWLNKSAMSWVIQLFIIKIKTYHYHFVTRVQKEYSILKDYEQDWPTCDMLKLHLRYTSEASCHSLTASTAKQLEKVHWLINQITATNLTLSDCNMGYLQDKVDSGRWLSSELNYCWCSTCIPLINDKCGILLFPWNGPQKITIKCPWKLLEQ